MKRAWKNNRAINEITHMKKAGHKNLWNVPNIAITKNLIPGNRLFYLGESLDTFMSHVVKSKISKNLKPLQTTWISFCSPNMVTGCTMGISLVTWNMSLWTFFDSLMLAAGSKIKKFQKFKKSFYRSWIYNKVSSINYWTYYCKIITGDTIFFCISGHFR